MDLMVEMQPSDHMRIIQVNHSDINGGAARAAYRTHHALRRVGVDSRMWVNKAYAADWTVKGPVRPYEKLIAAVRPIIGGQLRHLLRTSNPILHSFSALPSYWHSQLNASDADVVHLHWVGAETLSIADIGRINKPVVWTLHDMWAFCGAEHYTDDERWRVGYCKHNRPSHEGKFDLNRWTWRRKSKHWLRPMHIIAPSRWLADCVRESVLMRDWPVTVVPNPLDTERWRPLPQSLARELLGLPAEVPLLLFGAMGGVHDPRKGFDLLLQALEHLRESPEARGLELVVFGQLAPKSQPDLGFPIHYTGHLYDDLSLRALYSAASVLAIPSRQDNLPNTGLEAHACGTPVVTFDVGGLSDIIQHGQTGYLAKAFDVAELAQCIISALGNLTDEESRKCIHQETVKRFSYPVVAAQYRRIYEGVAI